MVDDGDPFSAFDIICSGTKKRAAGRIGVR